MSDRLNFPSCKYPGSIPFRRLCAFSCEVADTQEAEKITFDTNPVKFFSPTSMIFLAKICRTRARQYKEETVSFIGLSKHTYANNMGFADALNLQDRPFPKNAFGNNDYIPMSNMNREALKKCADAQDIALGDAIQLTCNDISLVVSRNRLELQETIANSFREIFRNVFEHSETDHAGYCVQYYPSHDEVEICIADRGIGVYNSLISDKKHANVSPYEALMGSLMPGVSSKARKHRKKKSHQKSAWDNSGFGLFFTHQIFGELGHFAIASGQHALFIEKGRPVEHLDCNIEGTLVSMRLNLSDPAKIAKIVAGVSKQAHKIKERIGTKSIDFASVEAFLAKEIEF